VRRIGGLGRGHRLGGRGPDLRPSEQAPGGLGIGLGLIPFLLLILVGSFMLGGREQVEAIKEDTIATEGEESRA